MKYLTASALPTVLVISILILIVIAMGFQYWNINSFYYLRYHAMKQQKMHLSSALILFCSDSTFSTQIKEQKQYQIYEDDKQSVVHLDYFPWGLYECINTSNFDESIRTTHFIGKSQDTYQSPALWVCEGDHAISLSGESELLGNLFLPKSGINYISLDFASYVGKIIPYTSIRTSDKELPQIDSTYIKLMDNLRKRPALLSEEIPSHYYSFFNEPIYRALPNTDEALYAKGRLVLYGDRVRVPASWKISDVLLVGKHVTIEEGFSGAMQIIATDTVIIEKGAYLHQPSGVYLRGNENKTYLHLCEGSHLEGYALVEGDEEGREGFVVDIHYRQDEGARLTGLLYVNGIAHVEGEIVGAAYMKECYYLSGEHMYTGLIYNARITRSNNLAFPVLFKNSVYRRQKMKKIE